MPRRLPHRKSDARGPADGTPKNPDVFAESQLGWWNQRCQGAHNGRVLIVDVVRLSIGGEEGADR